MARSDRHMAAKRDADRSGSWLAVRLMRFDTWPLSFGHTSPGGYQ